MKRLTEVFERARLAGHVLLGRPLAYRVTVRGGLEVGKRANVIECAFLGLPYDSETGLLDPLPPPPAVRVTR